MHVRYGAYMYIVQYLIDRYRIRADRTVKNSCGQPISKKWFYIEERNCKKNLKIMAVVLERSIIAQY